MAYCMTSEYMQSLSLVEAVACYEALPVALRPATLHPAYVAADACRSPALLPTYLRFQSASACWLHSLHIADIAGTPNADASSPYGYGGPLSSSNDSAFLRSAWAAYVDWMRARGVVVEYLRFHPLLDNQLGYPAAVLPNREVVLVDLAVPDLLASYAPRLRTTVNKAVRAGLVYSEAPLAKVAKAFATYYRAAMQAMGAEPFYWFEDDYFEQLAASGLARLGVCQSAGNMDAAAPWLAACLLLEGRGVTEYHLAATCESGRRVGASSFALHSAALHASQRGQHQLYLGGGSNPEPDNSLLFFKAAFSSQSLAYHTGSQVFNAAAYEGLKRHFPQAWLAHPERSIFYRLV